MEETNKTIDYYNSNAAQYFSNTVNVDMSECCDRFLEYVVPGGRIIDIGAGSGRDIKYFQDKGYIVEGIDASEEMCRLATEYTGVNVRCESVQYWHPSYKYDGIWANASLLHLNVVEFKNIIRQMHECLNERGSLFISVKKGTGEYIDEYNRYFNTFVEEDILSLFKEDDLYELKEIWISEDGLKRKTSWINSIVKRKQINREEFAHE